MADFLEEVSELEQEDSAEVLWAEEGAPGPSAARAKVWRRHPSDQGACKARGGRQLRSPSPSPTWPHRQQLPGPSSGARPVSPSPGLGSEGEWVAGAGLSFLSARLAGQPHLPTPAPSAHPSPSLMSVLGGDPSPHHT